MFELAFRNNCNLSTFTRYDIVDRAEGTEESISHQKNLSITASELKLLEKRANDQDLLIKEIRVKMANASTHSDKVSHIEIKILVN